MSWLIALGILAILFLLPVGAKGEYSRQGWWVDAVVGFVTFRLYPPKPKKPKRPKTPAPPPASGQTPPAKSGGTVKGLRLLLTLAKKLFGILCRFIWILHLDVQVTSAGKDPFDTAMLFGASGAVAGTVTAILTNTFHVRQMHVETSADFQAKEPTVYAAGTAVIALGAIIYALAVAALHWIRMEGKRRQKPAEKTEGAE